MNQTTFLIHATIIIGRLTVQGIKAHLAQIGYCRQELIANLIFTACQV